MQPSYTTTARAISADIAALPSQIMAMASDRGFVHIVGRPASLSQYGREYHVIINGVEIEEGSRIDVSDINATLGRWSAMLDEMHADQRAIVWRRQPELEWNPERALRYVRMRLHFQSVAHLAPVISWQEGVQFAEMDNAA